MIINELFKWNAAKETNIGRFIINCKAENQNFVFEDAPADIGAYETAHDMAQKFAHWMSKHNEDTPLGDIYEGSTLRLREKTLLVFPADKMGIDRDDLKIGFAWTNDGSESTTRGLLQRMLDPDTLRVIYYVACVVSRDPRKDVDVAYGIRWSTLIHELTHYLDFTRGFKGKAKFAKHTPDSSQADTYYNDPTEFNAHFQQGLYDIMSKFNSPSDKAQSEVAKSLSSFADFKKWALPSMPKSFLLYLNAEYKRKFERRLYKLYTFLVDKFTQKQAA